MVACQTRFRPRLSPEMHALRNALRLDPVCGRWLDLAVIVRESGMNRAGMRHCGLRAVAHARLVAPHYASLPPAA